MLWAAIVLLTFPQTACNTIDGVGKDLSSAARGVKEAIPESGN
jgi:predicted small secreted protein